MLPLSAISINWTGPQLTPEQILIIQDAALDFEQRDSDARLMFEHPSCAGMIECKSRMTHGDYRGTRFIATLDAADGKKRTLEFLLTDLLYAFGTAGSEVLLAHGTAQEQGPRSRCGNNPANSH